MLSKPLCLRAELTIRPFRLLVLLFSHTDARTGTQLSSFSPVAPDPVDSRTAPRCLP